MSATVTCCRPRQAPSPSGWSWIHSSMCKVAPRQKIRTIGAARTPSPATEPELAEEPTSGVHKLAVDEVHPVCELLNSLGSTPCSRCSWLLGLDNEGSRYVDAHVDDGWGGRR